MVNEQDHSSHRNDSKWKDNAVIDIYMDIRIDCQTKLNKSNNGIADQPCIFKFFIIDNNLQKKYNL